MQVDIEEMAKSLPPEAAPVLRKAGYFEPDRLQVGALTPVLALQEREGNGFVEIGGEGRDRPVVLIFGSYT